MIVLFISIVGKFENCWSKNSSIDPVHESAVYVAQSNLTLFAVSVTLTSYFSMNKCAMAGCSGVYMGDPLISLYLIFYLNYFILYCRSERYVRLLSTLLLIPRVFDIQFYLLKFCSRYLMGSVKIVSYVDCSVWLLCLKSYYAMVVTTVALLLYGESIAHFFDSKFCFSSNIKFVFEQLVLNSGDIFLLNVSSSF